MTQGRSIPGFFSHVVKRIEEYYQVLTPVVREAQKDGAATEGDPYILAVWDTISPRGSVGIAYFFLIDLDIAATSTNYSPSVLATVKEWKPDFMKARMIEVGHIASLGRTIEVAEPWRNDFLHALSETIDTIGRLEDADFCFIRDIDFRCATNYRPLEECGYLPVEGYPIARMKLGWKNFDGYVAALKAKKTK